LCSVVCKLEVEVDIVESRRRGGLKSQWRECSARTE
jgi:hypothetical protein